MNRLNSILVPPTLTIRNALKQMDSSGGKILFVVDEATRLLGVVTDGNIRRWMLKGGKLSAAIKKAMHPEPVMLNDGYRPEEAKEKMLSKAIECIPVVDTTGKVVSVVWWTDLFKGTAQKKGTIALPVVLMAGGEGTRLAPFTKILPKPLMPIGDKPVIELIINRFYDYGCTDFYLSVNYKSNIIKAYFEDFKHPYDIRYVREDKPLGTAGSLNLLRNRFKKTFFVSNCDILIEADFEDIVQFHKSSGNKITLVGSMKHYTIPYGVCTVGVSGQLNKIDEKPEYDFLVNTGMYVLEPEVLKLIPRDKMFHMTDLIASCRAKGWKVGVYPISEKSWLDMGQWEDLKETLKRFGV